MGSNTNTMTDLSILNLSDSKKAIYYAMGSNTPIHFIGPPGVGKSAIVEGVAVDMHMPLETLLLSQCDPTDVGGFPVVINGKLERLPLGAIKAACEKPTILFLDELSCAPPAVQGAAMQLIYNRRAGDVKLHPDTRIVAASNPADQAAGGWELALPLISRLTQIKMRPEAKEIQEYFYNIGIDPATVQDLSDADKKDPVKVAAHKFLQLRAMVRRIGVDFAATLESSPDLLQIEPPQGAQAEGRAWGAPRSWERAIAFVAQALLDGESDTGTIFTAGLSGNVGSDAAAAYMSIRKLRGQLPGIKEILNTPDQAKIPTSMDVGIAVLGILAQVATQDPCPAWVYADRIKTQEVRVAAMNVLGRPSFGLKNFKNSPWYKQADAAQTALLRGIGNAMRNQ